MNRALQFSLSFAATLVLLTGCGDGDTAQAPSAPPSPATSIPTVPPAQTTSAPLPPNATGTPAPVADQSGLLVPAGKVSEDMTPDPAGDQTVGILQTASDSFYSAFQRPAASFQELIKSGYLRAVPAAPAGKKYVIDAQTGEISSVNAK